MQGTGTPGEWLREKKGGEIHQQNIDEVWIERRPGSQYAEARKADRKFRFLRTLGDEREVCDDAREIIARYVKFIHHVVTQLKNVGKKVAILSRTNDLHHLSDLSVFVRKLKSCFTREQVEQLGGSKAIDWHFWIGTAHSFKGLEADIVFLVWACQGAFPLVHPNYVLFKLFGDSEQQILDDERRLFSVAVTRAKEQVWFLTETDRESDFVSALMETMEPNKSHHGAGSPRAARSPRR